MARKTFRRVPGGSHQPNKPSRRQAGKIADAYGRYFSLQRERTLQNAGLTDMTALNRVLRDAIGEKTGRYMEKLGRGEIFVIGIAQPKGPVDYVVVPDGFLTRTELAKVGGIWKNRKFVTKSQFEKYLMDNPGAARWIQELIPKQN